jgi:hypothetical protein
MNEILDGNRYFVYYGYTDDEKEIKITLKY